MTAEELELKRKYQQAACKRYAERHPERRKEQNRLSNAKRYAKNRDKYLALAKEYRQANREAVNAKSKECRLRNADIYRRRKIEYYHKNKVKILEHSRTPVIRYRYSISVAKKRCIAWNIPESDYRELISSPRCHYRNHPLGNSGVGLDRIDNAKGYIVGNIVPCCGNCNRIKCHLLSYREMVAIGKLLDEMSFSKATEGVPKWL